VDSQGTDAAGFPRKGRGFNQKKMGKPKDIRLSHNGQIMAVYHKNEIMFLKKEAYQIKNSILVFWNFRGELDLVKLGIAAKNTPVTFTFAPDGNFLLNQDMYEWPKDDKDFDSLPLRLSVDYRYVDFSPDGNFALAQQAARLNQIEASQRFGGLTRQLNDASIKARDAELLRRRQELQLPIEAAKTVAGQTANYGVPSINTSPYGDLLGLVGQIGGQYLSNQQTEKMMSRYYPSGSGGYGYNPYARGNLPTNNLGLGR
jgi:hypothetical protein